MNINDFIITVAKALKADYFFKNIKIIKPFENVSYAGEIKNTFVCVGLDEMEITPIELGDDTKYANVKIKVGIFTEKNNSAFAKDVFLNICRVSQKFNITSIKAQPLEYVKQAKGYRLNGYFSFGTNIDFGGESGE